MDEQLWKGVRAGDRESQIQFVEMYHGQLVGMAGSRLRPALKHQAEDVAQKTWIAFFKYLHKIDGLPMPYLTSILFNECSRLARNAHRLRFVSLGNVQQGDGESTSIDPIDHREPAPDQRRVAGDAKDELQQALAQLSEEHRQVILLRCFDGLSYGAIAAVVEIPLGTVKSRLRDAKEKLRELLS